MVRKQCFEVGCLGGESVQKRGVVFQVGCDSELYLLWFLGKKKIIRKKKIKTSFAGAHITRNSTSVLVFVVSVVVGRTQPQESQLPSSAPSWCLRVWSRATSKPISCTNHRSPCRGSLCFLFGGSGGVFPQRRFVRAFGLASMGLLPLVPQAGGAGVGFLGTELSGLLEMRGGCRDPSRSTDRASLSFSERERT